jgi:LEA14-like dessication related protein
MPLLGTGFEWRPATPAVMKNLRLLAPLLLLLASCAKPQNLVYKGVSNFYVSALGVNRTAIGADVMLYNPNSYPLDIKDADLDLSLNNRPAGKAVLDQRLSIPARDSVAVPVEVDASLGNIVNAGFQLLKNPEVMVKLNGTVKACLYACPSAMKESRS